MQSNMSYCKQVAWTDKVELKVYEIKGAAFDERMPWQSLNIGVAIFFFGVVQQ